MKLTQSFYTTIYCYINKNKAIGKNSVYSLLLILVALDNYAQIKPINTVKLNHLVKGFSQNTNSQSTLSKYNDPIKVAYAYGCRVSPLGVFDITTNNPVSSPISCNYSGGIYLAPTTFFLPSDDLTTAPCLQLSTGIVPANAQINNTATFAEGANPSPFLIFNTANGFPWTNSAVNNFAGTSIDPTLTHTVQICNISPSSSFSYTIASCYNNTPFATGVYLNNTSNTCVGIPIPANVPVGLVGFSVTPTIPTTAYAVYPWGAISLDPKQMPAGTYTVSYYFNSQNGCNTVSTQTISIFNPFNANWTNLSALCENAACAPLNPRITGTSGGLFYGSSVTGNNFCASNTGVGNFPVTYSVGITPTCMASLTNTVIVNANPVATASNSSVLNCTNTAITLTATGGGSYTWAGPGITSGGSTANPIVNAGGIYNVTITAANSCTATANTTVVQNTVSPSLNLGTANTVTTTCSSPSVALSATSNADPNSSYTWNTPYSTSINGTPVFVSAAGIYTVSVTNTLTGCSSATSPTTVQVVGIISPTVTLSSNSETLTCTTSTVSITASVNPTTVTYTWIPSTGIVSGANTANPIFNATGTYSLLVTNTSNNCVANSAGNTVTVISNTSAPTVSITPISTNSVIGCGTNSLVTLAVASTPTNVSYNWLPSNITTATITINSGGVYSVTVTDVGNGCATTANASVTQNTTSPSLNFSTANSLTLTCSSSTVTLAATSNADPNSAYTWNTPYSTTINGTPIFVTVAGIYTVSVIDGSSGCVATASTTVVQNTVSPSLNLGTANTVTTTCSSPSVALSATSNADPNSSYTWNTPYSTSINGTPVFVSVAGIYTVSVTNTLTGCSSATSPTTVQVVAGIISPTVTLSSNSETLTCTTTTVSITASVNPTTVTYTWVPSTGIVSGANTANPIFNATGTYSLLVTNTTNNCVTNSAGNTVTVISNTSAPTVSITPISTNSVIGCGTNSLVTLAVASTPTNVSYNWLPSNITTATITISSGGIYSVAVTDGDNGCASIAQYSVVAYNTAPNFIVDFSTNPASGTAPLLVNFTNQSVGVNTYNWFLGDGTMSSATNTSNTFTVNGTYSVTLIGSNVYGCIDSVSKIIIVNEAVVLIIPNFFTPHNGDGKNDLLFINDIDKFPNNTLEIYNRWGNLVYLKKEYNNTFDGKSNQPSMGTGLLPASTYFIVLDLGDGVTKPYHGYVELKY